MNIFCPPFEHPGDFKTSEFHLVYWEVYLSMLMPLQLHVSQPIFYGVFEYEKGSLNQLLLWHKSPLTRTICPQLVSIYFFDLLKMLGEIETFAPYSPTRDSCWFWSHPVVEKHVTQVITLFSEQHSILPLRILSTKTASNPMTPSKFTMTPSTQQTTLRWAGRYWRFQPFHTKNVGLGWGKLLQDRCDRNKQKKLTTTQMVWPIYYKSLTWFKAILGGIPLLNYHLGWPRLRSL